MKRVGQLRGREVSQEMTHGFMICIIFFYNIDESRTVNRKYSLKVSNLMKFL